MAWEVGEWEKIKEMKEACMRCRGCDMIHASGGEAGQRRCNTCRMKERRCNVDGMKERRHRMKRRGHNAHRIKRRECNPCRMKGR